jgi:ribosomal protein S18 acetylase RimI-like enzyme
METQVKIREYNHTDKNDLIQILRINTPKYFSSAEEIDFINYLENEIDVYYVLLVGNKIIGCGGINTKNEMEGIISWGIIHPDFQGFSFGTLLLQHRITALRELKNCKTIHVRTSQLVFKFYEKNGFKLMKIVENYWAQGFHLYEMEYLM